MPTKNVCAYEKCTREVGQMAMGRPRRYCESLCRQRAYRERQRRRLDSVR